MSRFPTTITPALARSTKSHDDPPHSFLRLQGSSLEFRDEQIYLKSIASYVHLTPSSRKGKEKEHDLPNHSGEVIIIEWRKVLWVTARDQLLTPLLRGLIWGIAGQYVGRITSFFVGANGKSRASKPHKEGQGVGWLRKWISHLTSGTRVSTAAIPSRGF